MPRTTRLRHASRSRGTPCAKACLIRCVSFRNGARTGFEIPWVKEKPSTLRRGSGSVATPLAPPSLRPQEKKPPHQLKPDEPMRRMSDCAIRRRASSAEPLLWILAFGATFTSAPISSWVSVPSVRIWTRTAPLSRGSCIATRSAWSAATYRGTDTKRCELRYLSCFATSPRRMCTTSRGLPSPRAPVCCLRPSPVGMTMAPSLELRRTKASHGDAMSDAAPAVGEAAGDVDDSAAVSR
eukprot:7377321-Prymnesium_polylepis.1